MEGIRILNIFIFYVDQENLRRESVDGMRGSGGNKWKKQIILIIVKNKFEQVKIVEVGFDGIKFNF